MARKEKTKSPGAVTAAQRAYQEELRQRRKKNLLGTIAAMCLVFFLVMIFWGGRFEGILRVFGLKSISNEKTGVYADCSKAVNRDSPYCKPKVPAYEKEWKDISQTGGKYRPFNLRD